MSWAVEIVARKPATGAVLSSAVGMRGVVGARALVKVAVLPEAWTRRRSLVGIVDLRLEIAPARIPATGKAGTIGPAVRAKAVVRPAKRKVRQKCVATVEAAHVPVCVLMLAVGRSGARGLSAAPKEHVP